MRIRRATAGRLAVAVVLAALVALFVGRGPPDPGAPEHDPAPTGPGAAQTPPPPVLVGRGDADPVAPAEPPAAPPADGTGSVVVRMVDAQGVRVEDSTQEVYLFWRARGTRGAWQREGTPGCRMRAGEGRIDAVPTGQDVQVRVIDPLYFCDLFDAPGPTRPGEVTTLEVPLGPRRPVLTGVLLDPDGEPLASQDVRLHQRLEEFLPDGFAQSAVRRTDPAGRFEWAMAYAPSRGVWLSVERDAGEVLWRATVEVPRDATGRSDLGLVRLEPDRELSPIASGRVVDEAGRPLSSGVRVLAYAGAGSTTITLTRVPAEVQPDGSFVIRTGVDPLPDELNIQATQRGRAAATVTVARGAQDVVLVLRPAGRLHASFRIPDGIPGGCIVGYVQRQGTDSAGCPNQFGGYFGYDELAAGTYDVFVKVRDSPWELARVEGVFVPEGGQADDERIRDIPLDGLVRPCRIRLVAPEGSSLAGRHVSVELPDGARATFTVQRDGVLTIVAPPRYETFRVAVYDVGTAEVHWSAEEQSITLEP